MQCNKWAAELGPAVFGPAEQEEAAAHAEHPPTNSKKADLEACLFVMLTLLWPAEHEVAPHGHEGGCKGAATSIEPAVPAKTEGKEREDAVLEIYFQKIQQTLLGKQVLTLP